MIDEILKTGTLEKIAEKKKALGIESGDGGGDGETSTQHAEY